MTVVHIRNAYAIIQDMKRRAQAGGISGFTIVETMIVLAVTSAMFIVAVLAFSGQRDRTSFTQANRDFESKIRDVANDVSAGYFPDMTGVSCQAGATVTFGAPSDVAQGTNDQCIFLGKAVQLTGCTDGCDVAPIETIAGRRQYLGKEVTSLSQALPTVAPDYTELYAMQYGLIPKKVMNDQGETIAGFAVLSSLAGYEGNDPVSGSQSSSLYGVGTGTDFAAQVSAVREDDRTDEVVICLSNNAESVDGRKSALILTDSAAGIVTEVKTDNVPEGCSNV